jgi:hypothetical protein
METFLAYLGGILSSVLGIVQLVRWHRERPQIRVDAHLSYDFCREDPNPKATRVDVPGRGPRDVTVKVRIANAGQVSLQIDGLTLILAEAPKAYDIRPQSFPLVLAPYTSVTVHVQKGWFDHYDALAFGAIDGLGRSHLVFSDALDLLVAQCRSLPMEEREGVDPRTGLTVRGFQALDNGDLVDIDVVRLPKKLRKLWKS